MADLSGMETECIPHDVLVDELNRIVGWKDWDESIEGKKKPKFEPGENLPRIHSAATQNLFSDNPDDIVNHFIDYITFDPATDTILGSNHKIEQSGLTQEIYVKIGIPAFVGILYDENRNISWVH
jgi:hypothetical protein